MNRSSSFVLVTAAIFALQVFVVANIQTEPEADDVFQREHTLVKPYQGSGMVSTLNRKSHSNSAYSILWIDSFL